MYESIVLGRIKLITNHGYLSLIARSREVINCCHHVSLYQTLIRMKEHPPDKAESPPRYCGPFFGSGLNIEKFLVGLNKTIYIDKEGCWDLRAYYGSPPMCPQLFYSAPWWVPLKTSFSLICKLWEIGVKCWFLGLFR